MDILYPVPAGAATSGTPRPVLPVFTDIGLSPAWSW